MDELLTILLPAVIGAVVAFLILYMKEIILFKKQQREKIERNQIEKKLDKLYSPLYAIIKSNEIVHKKRILSYNEWTTSTGIKENNLNHLLNIIEQGLYLASNELQPQLAKFYINPTEWYEKDGISDKDKRLAKELADLIIKEYVELRKKYYNIG